MRTVSAPDGDLPAGGLAVADGIESLRQRVAQRVRLFLGEWFLDTLAGVPYDSDVLRRPASVGLAVAAVTTAIRSVPGVVDVEGATGEIDAVTRTFRYVATVRAEEGSAEVSATMGDGGSVDVNS